MKINGKKIANKILLELEEGVKKLKEKKVIPHLAVILVGSDPSSISYVNQKEIKGKKIGAKITIKTILTNITQSQLTEIIEQFNNKTDVHGIIVQRPLPESIDKNDISLAINPSKDVDGFLPNSKFEPPIALAILRILEEIFKRRLLREGVSFNKRGFRKWLTSKRFHLDKGGTFTKWLTSQKIIVIGKGETGGRPVINMLKKMDIEPRIIDSKTKNPELITKIPDIIISAVGKQNVIRPEMIKKGVILIGVGMHKGKNGKLHADYDEEKIKNIASFYTPTPGGVGPVNVAMLLQNLVKATEIPNT